MPRTKFEGILVSIIYTDQNYVEYYDGLLHMRKKEDAWNLNMSENFNTSLINVLGESMMEWFNKYALIFMCVGCKPHTFGNERQTICCGPTYIFWRAQIL